MTEHIQRFAQLLKIIESPHHRGAHAAAVTRDILRVFDQSDDVPGEIEALLRAEFAKVVRHG
jgi:hypothetical protein